MSWQHDALLPADLTTAIWVLFDGASPLCPEAALFWTYDQLPCLLLRERLHALGDWQGRRYIAADCSDLALALPRRSLRELLVCASAEEQAVLVRASQILLWARQHRFCSACAQPLRAHAHDRARVCPSCDLHFYPRIHPCIIVLVRRGRSMLLAQGVRFQQPMLSTLAGFIEAGESAEESVHREVFEEVGIVVNGLHYVASQSWPFPQSLMLAFMADYVSGDIRCDPQEIRLARWVEPEEDVPLPPPVSIARQLIERHRRAILA